MEIWVTIWASGDNKYGLRINGEDGRYVTADESSVTLNAWVHYAGVFDGDKIRLYKNGNLEQETNPSFVSINSNSNNPRIGSGFNGLIDDVRIYNRALSASEIYALYTLTLGVADACSNPAGVEGTMIYNADYSVMQYCDGMAWIGIGK